MHYVLYAIEEWTGDVSTDQWELITRFDEEGVGSPLTWPTEEDAQAVIDDFEEETGVSDEMRIVKLTGESPR